MMTAAVTGYADAFWSSAAWYLNICRRIQVRQEMEKILVRMEKILVRMEKILVRMEKILVCFRQAWSCHLEAVTRGFSSKRKERALRCLFLSEM